MKHIQYTLVDAKTNVPLSENPAARNGVKHPDGLIPVFMLESTVGPVPVFYGLAEDDFQPAPWMREVDESAFLEIFKVELKQRAEKRREQVLQGGVEVNGVVFKTDDEAQSRIGNVILGLTLDPTIEQIDQFKAANGWRSLTRDEIIAAGKAVFAHVQKCFAWCGNIHARIDSEVTTPESGDALAIEIEQFAG